MIHLVCPNPAVDRTILIDSLTAGEVHRPEDVREFPGGKSFNVAYALASQGLAEQVQIHTILGGTTGQRVQELSDLAGYNLSTVEVPTPTRFCQIIVARQTNQVYPIYERGFNLSESLLQSFTDQLVASVQPGDYIVFSGSLMKGMPDNYISHVYQQINNDSVKLIVDTSGDALSATYHTCNPYLIKINDEEFQQLFPEFDGKRPSEYIEFMKQYVRPEIVNFIVTLGGDGAIARMGNAYAHYVQNPINVLNPIASGDIFLGGIISQMIEDTSMDTMISTALALAGSNCCHWFPEIDQEQVQQLQADTHITRYGC